MSDAQKTPAQQPAEASTNPLLSASTLPFQAPPFDKIKDSDYLPAFEEGMRQHLADVRKIADSSEPATFDNTIVAMERSGETLTRVSRIFFGLVRPTPTMRARRSRKKWRRSWPRTRMRSTSIRSCSRA